jgi:hypothetical protein
MVSRQDYFRPGDDGVGVAEYHVKCTHSKLCIPNDNGLHGLRGCVVARCEFQMQAVNVSQLERFGNLLFVTASLVAATHLRVLSLVQSYWDASTIIAIPYK